MKGFFPLKVWAKNVGAPYTWQNTGMSLTAERVPTGTET